MKDTVKIALTGGIGSGKSLALSIIKQAGYFTVSCDSIAAELYEDVNVKEKLKEIFPQAVSGEENFTVDKRKIAQTAFNDKTYLNKLNALMHPLIMERCFKLAETCCEKIAFIEVPLLFECGLAKFFDKVLIIMRDDKERIKSVKKRSSLTDEEIIARIKNQTDYNALDTSGYQVIVNDGSFEDLRGKILDFCKNTEASLG